MVGKYYAEQMVKMVRLMETMTGLTFENLTDTQIDQIVDMGFEYNRASTFNDSYSRWIPFDEFGQELWSQAIYLNYSGERLRYDSNGNYIGHFGGKGDKNKNFEILLKIGDNIQISYIGRKTIELPILSSPISVYLETDLNELDEVTVSVGYFDISEKDLSGSITQIKSEQLEKNRSGSVESILQGQVSVSYTHLTLPTNREV